MIESATPMDCRPIAVNRMMIAQRTTVETVPERIRPTIVARKKPAAMIAPPNSTLPPRARISLRNEVICGKPSTWAPITAKNSTTAISTTRSTAGTTEEPCGRISCLISQESTPELSRSGRNRPETKRAMSTPMPTSTTAAMMFGIAVNTAVSIAAAGSEIEAMPRICSAAIDTTIMISANTTCARISGTFEGSFEDCPEDCGAAGAPVCCPAGAVCAAGPPVTPPVARSRPDCAVPSSFPKSTVFSAVRIRARTIFAIVRPMMKTNAAPMMFGRYPRALSSITTTGERTWESWKMPSTTISPSSHTIIEAIAPSEVPRPAPSTPGFCRAGIFRVRRATAPLTTAARIAVTTRMTMAARTLRPSSAQLTLDRKSTRSSDARGKGRRP